MAETTRKTRFTASQEASFTATGTVYTDKRSVTDTLLEALGQSGVRPTMSRQAADRRARYGRLAGGLALATAVAILGFVWLRPVGGPSPAADRAAPGGVAVVELVRGDLGMLPASAGVGSSQLLTLAAGEAIHAGTVVETGSRQTGSRQTAAVDASNRAALRLAGGQSVRLDADSRVRFASSSSLVLERGAVYVDSNAGAEIEVRTTLGVVRDVGTQFEVRMLTAPDAAASVRIRVREGKVVLERGLEAHDATAGVELSVAAGGVVTRGESSVYGRHWDWVLDSAPVPDVAGWRLDRFLEWVAREGGWAIGFDDEATAGLASATILHGDVQGLTPTAAAAMVLRSSGLEYRLEEGTLMVNAAEPVGE